ncbi:unnamed protein product [Lathyrus sativus]|nr:unnamed protein product [Lathyrus sativus]
MESKNGSGPNIHHTTFPSTSSSSSEPLTSQNKSQLSHDDHIHFMPNSTTTTHHHENASFLHTNDQTNLANPFGEFHSPYQNNKGPSFSSTQNPFLLLSHHDTNESQKLHDHAPFEPNFHQLPKNESSLGNPFHDSHKFVQHHDHGNNWHHQDHWNFPNHEVTTTHASSSSHLLDPLFTLESTQNQQLDNASHKNPKGYESSTQQNMHESHPTGFESSTQQHKHDSPSASSNTEKDTHVHPKSREGNMLVSESNDDDFPVRSMPKHEQKKSSTVASVPETIQNPPIQIMERQERQENCSTSPSSTPRIPLHVFDKDKLNAQWSSTSNESLFSIQMGKSFSNDMAWLSKSGELDKNVDHMNMSSGVQSNHPPLSPQTQATKFTDISPNFTEQHESNSKVTEAKAAETMREVIMETSKTPEHNKSKGFTPISNAAMHSDALFSSNHDHHDHDHSRYSNGSTQSFAFKSYADGDKPLWSKQDEETKKQQKQPELQNVKATVAPPSAQNTKPASNASSNASQNRWLSCFTCCH